MKLLNKNNLYYFIFSLTACIAIGISFYLVTKHLIYEEVESRLLVEKRDFEDYVKKNGGVWHNSCYFVEDKIHLVPVDPPTTVISKDLRFTDTLLYDEFSKDLIRFRQLSFYKKLENKYYLVHLRKSLLESDKLLKYLTVTILSLLSVAFSVMYFIQRKMSENIWYPFYNTLNKIKSFDLRKDNELDLGSTSIYEFNELNKVIERMSKKIKQDYSSLKEFTENASHEIQTPLALINARVEELIQSRNLSEKELHLINEIHASSLRLSKLGSALLLLSKIENDQFEHWEPINFERLIKKKLEEFEEIFRHRGLSVELVTEGSLVLNINTILADMLLTNLIGNAVKHNLSKGRIRIALWSTGFKISNTGLPLTEDPSSLFQRFKKGKHKSDSSGLGLAIVQQICISYNLSVSYTYENNLHVLQISNFIT